MQRFKIECRTLNSQTNSWLHLAAYCQFFFCFTGLSMILNVHNHGRKCACMRMESALRCWSQGFQGF